MGSAALAAVGTGLPAAADNGLVPSRTAVAEFNIYQERRRWELWDLLGDLPWAHKPSPPKKLSSEEHDGYTLERWQLDLNGIEIVPALLLIPHRRQTPAPGLLFMHWHGGEYDLGKEQLLRGTKVQPAYAPVCVEKGLVTLAIDSWCFGERKHGANGHEGEEDTFKKMLWEGQVLYGMMMFDEHRALNFLASRAEVDPNRLGAFGMSMGATKAWWLGALDTRIRLVMDVCCLTDYASLLKDHGLKGHSVYYFVSSLLKRFDTFGINELIVPRPRISVNGRHDPLTPPEGVIKVRDELLPLYRTYGREQDCKIDLYDCAHQELPAMRQQILEGMDQYLVARS
ncbi:MAG: alpha/beta hydrolase family protein [Bryocella sp.]